MLCFQSSTFVVQQCFSNNRALAGGCSLLGFSMGILICPTMITFLIQTYGWRGTMLIMSAVSAHTIVFGAFMKKSPKANNLEDTGLNTYTCITDESDGEKHEQSCTIRTNTEIISNSNPNSCLVQGVQEELKGVDNREKINEVDNANNVVLYTSNRTSCTEGTEGWSETEHVEHILGKAVNTCVECDKSTTPVCAELTSLSGKQYPSHEHIIEGRKSNAITDEHARLIDTVVSDHEDDTLKTRGKHGVGAHITDILKDVVDVRIFKEIHLVLVCICSMMSWYNYTTFIQHMPSKTAVLGYSKENTALFLSVFSITAITGRILVAILANMRGVNRILVFGLGCVVGCGASFLTLVHSYVGMIAASATYGIFIGKY